MEEGEGIRNIERVGWVLVAQCEEAHKMNDFDLWEAERQGSPVTHVRAWHECRRMRMIAARNKNAIRANSALQRSIVPA